MPVQTFSGALTGSATDTGTLARTRRGFQAPATATVTLTAALGKTGHGFAGGSTSTGTVAAPLGRTRKLTGASTGTGSATAAMPKGKPMTASTTAGATLTATVARQRRMSASTGGAASAAGAVALVRAINVLVVTGPEVVQVTEGAQMDTGLAPMPFRANESRAIAHRLLVNGSIQDLTGWTIELWTGTGTPSAAVLKTITGASSAATVGQIKNQGTNLGEYFFTILAADIVTLLGSTTALTVPCRIRYLTGAANPPNTFSTVVFPLVLTVS